MRRIAIKWSYGVFISLIHNNTCFDKLCKFTNNNKTSKIFNNKTASKKLRFRLHSSVVQEKNFFNMNYSPARFASEILLILWIIVDLVVIC